MTVISIPIRDRQSWLEMRMQDVTASDIGAICGVEAYKSALGVWMEKAGLSKPQEDSALMKRGRHLEDAVLNYLREEEPVWDIAKPQTYFRDPDLRIGATPDAFASTGEKTLIIQCKVVSRPVFEKSWDNEPPLCYQFQALTEAMLCDTDSAYVAALVIDTFGAKFCKFERPRNAKAEAMIRRKVAEFWAAVDAGQQPKADYSHDAELLQQLYQGRAKVEFVDLSKDNMLPVILEERSRLMDDIKTREARIEQIRCEVLEKLGTAERGALPGWKISNTMTNRKEYTVAAKSYPTLRITKEKEKD